MDQDAENDRLSPTLDDREMLGSVFISSFLFTTTLLLHQHTNNTYPPLCVLLLNDPELTKNVKLPTQPLDFKAFAALMAKNHKGAETSDEAYGALFNNINKDGSGNVSSAELRAALQHFGNNSLSEADIDEIVHEADVSGDG
ncbi:hypothetical protein BGZ70_003623, partial [Mortierella alpina]